MALAASALALLPAAVASAAPVTNTNDAGPGSLRQAIEEAAPGETVTVPAGTYTLMSDPLTLEKSLTITGAGAGDTVIRSGPAIRVFEIFGPGINVAISGVTIRDGLVASMSGVALGGGVFAVEANLALHNVVVTNNRAIADGEPGTPGGVALGGGIFIEDEAAGNASIVTSTIDRNLAQAGGGPGGSGGVVLGGGAFIGLEQSAGVLNRLTVAENSAQTSEEGIGLGGGLFVETEGPASVVLTGATISANTLGAPAPGEGGNLFAPGAVKIANTILSGGAGPAGSENCGVENGESLGFNIDSADQCGFKAAGDLVSTNPLLGPLQGNGGPTKTMALPPDSPAVDKGASIGLGADQRGAPRPIDFPAIPNSAAPGADGADIGAFELQPPSAVTPGKLQPLSAVTLGKIRRNRKKGTATLTAEITPPAVGTLTLYGKGLKTQTLLVDGSTATFNLQVIPIRGVKKVLRKRGRRKVGINVTYAPTGQAPATANRKAKLVKKKKKKRRRHKKR